MSTAEEVYYKLKSNDGEVFQISKKAAQLSGMLMLFLEIGDEESKTMEPIDLPNVSGKVTKQIIQWCEDHKDLPVTSHDKISTKEKSAEEGKEIEEKEKALLSELDREELLQLFMGADYLDIKSLHEIILRIIGRLISGKNYMEIRQLWMLEGDFTAEEEKEMATLDAWDLLVRDMEKRGTEEAAGHVAPVNLAGED